MTTTLPWPELEIPHWSGFVAAVSEITALSEVDPAYLFRGQSDAAWSLKPTLARVIPANTSRARACEMEARVYSEFGGQFHLVCTDGERHIYDSDSTFLDWWPEMQHYGAPTRLLDWTASPYVAAYFAAIANPDTDGALYVCHPATITERWSALENIQGAIHWHKDFRDGVYFFSPRRQSQRVATQQGHFSVAFDPMADHQQVLVKGCPPAELAAHDSQWLRRWIIPAALKCEFLRHLRRMNVTANSLFPGPDGLGRSMKELFAARLF